MMIYAEFFVEGIPTSGRKIAHVPQRLEIVQLHGELRRVTGVKWIFTGNNESVKIFMGPILAPDSYDVEL